MLEEKKPRRNLWRYKDFSKNCVWTWKHWRNVPVFIISWQKWMRYKTRTTSKHIRVLTARAAVWWFCWCFGIRCPTAAATLALKQTTNTQPWGQWRSEFRPRRFCGIIKHGGEINTMYLWSVHFIKLWRLTDGLKHFISVRVRASEIRCFKVLF